jgi:LysM repeat protein
VTPAEPDEGPEPAPDTPARADQTELSHADLRPPPRARRWWPWLVLLALILVATLGLIVGVGIVLRGRSFGPGLPSDTAARPTFVIASPPSPSPSASPRPAAVPSATASDEYIVAEGDTLRSIAQQVYGDAEQWPRIYAANRDTIGPDPDTLSAGTRLRIPQP